LQLAITELGSHSPKLETGMKLTSYGEPQMKCMEYLHIATVYK